MRIVFLFVTVTAYRSTSACTLTMIPSLFLRLCLLATFSGSLVAQLTPPLHPQPSRVSLYQTPLSPHDTRHLYTHLPHGEVQLRNAADQSTGGDVTSTMVVAVEASSEPVSWFATLAPIIGLSLSDTEAGNAIAVNETAQSNTTAAAYIVSMKSPTAMRHRQLLTEGISLAGYNVLAYLPHNSFLLVPDTADANETALVEWTLSSLLVQRTQRYAAQNKIDPLISQYNRIHLYSATQRVTMKAAFN